MTTGYQSSVVGRQLSVVDSRSRAVCRGRRNRVQSRLVCCWPLCLGLEATVWLIVGLGNPGEEYAKTRHNIGFQSVNEIARRHNLAFDDKRAKSRVATGQIAGQRVALAKPFTYMNLIGQAVVGLCQWYKVDPARD